MFSNIIVRVHFFYTTNYLRIFVAAMAIGFTQRIRTVSKGAVPGVDFFQLQINVSSLRPAETRHPMEFHIMESRTNATVETLTAASNVFDAAFGHRDKPNDHLHEHRDLPLGERTVSPLQIAIRNDLISEETECFTIGIFPVDVPGRKELFTCYEDSAGADSYFCDHTICIEDDDGRCFING